MIRTAVVMLWVCIAANAYAAEEGFSGTQAVSSGTTVKDVSAAVSGGAQKDPASAAADGGAPVHTPDAAPAASSEKPSTPAHESVQPAPEAKSPAQERTATEPAVSRSGVPMDKREGSDATHCLELGSNKEIILCAEKYRH